MNPRARLPLLLVPGGTSVVEVAVSDGLSIGSGERVGLVLPGLRPLHCRLSRVGGGHVIEGLGGPILINGKRHQRVELQSGDSIQLGRTKLTWLAPGGMVSTGRGGLGPRQRWDGRWGGIAAVCLLLILLGAWLSRNREPDSGDRSGIEASFSILRRWAAVGDWARALEELDRLEILAGPHDEWERYRAAILQETTQEALAATLFECVEAGDRTCSLGSWEALDRDSLTFLKKGETLSRALDTLPPPVDDRALAALEPAIEERAVRPGASSGRKERSPVSPSTRAPIRSRGSRTSLDGVVEAWVQGRLDEAKRRVVELEPTVSTRLAAAFQRHEAASRKAADLPGAAAFPWLEQMVAAEREIGAHPERTRGERRRLADLHVRAGRYAEQVKDWERAQRQHRLGLTVWSGHPAALEGLERIGKEAERIFLEGYAARELAPALARERFHLVLRLLPEGDPTREKTMRWLGELERSPQNRLSGL